MNNVTKQESCCAVKWKDPEMKALIEREIEKQKSTNLVDKYLPDSKKKIANFFIISMGFR